MSLSRRLGGATFTGSGASPVRSLPRLTRPPSKPHRGRIVLASAGMTQTRHSFLSNKEGRGQTTFQPSECRWKSRGLCFRACLCSTKIYEWALSWVLGRRGLVDQAEEVAWVACALGPENQNKVDQLSAQNQWRTVLSGMSHELAQKTWHSLCSSFRFSMCLRIGGQRMWLKETPLWDQLTERESTTCQPQ